MNILEDFQWRNLVADCTDREGLGKRVATGPITLYCGFDPTADSLHVGNLVPLFALRRFQLAGHHPIALAGGATGMVGDPSGKTDERSLLTPDQVAHNIESVKKQLAKFLDFDAKKNPARLVNNADWTAPVSYLEFLRDVGKHFTVNWMTAKESVRARMEGRDSGISYTEFSYMLLQAFDFYHLKKTFGCELQIGATDQWGNITAGCELCRKKLDATVWGLVFPLLTKSDGTKYGKTAAGSVWLDPRQTSPYRFYQFFINADDADVIRLLKALTFLSREEVTALEAEIKKDPGARAAQKALAKGLTTLVHGAAHCADAIQASESIFRGRASSLAKDQFQAIIPTIPSVHYPINDPSSPTYPIGKTLTEAVVISGLCSSKSQARNLIESGGIYVKDDRIMDPSVKITNDHLLFGEHLLLRKGPHEYAAVTPYIPPAGLSPLVPGVEPVILKPPEKGH
ncbi:MAG: tyrosine--tRNA ligase [Verrucomicrobia bacterium RIFCSPLOWO2_12_FULL_64_8]|nr:MAG: tyrosine--tRNA ligase [Verrucomicrobia bacterium RIFCSPLOWO2_12_FULL_64_8]